MEQARYRRSATVAVTVALGLVLVLAAAMPAVGFKKGRMTGGGRVNHPAGFHVTHGFELYCITLGGGGTMDLGPNNLEVNWDAGNHWHLEDLTKGGCDDEPRWDPRPPRAPIDVYYGAGYGRLNGVSGAFACWRLVDDGEPGTNDLFGFRVWAPGEAPNPANAASDPQECPRPDADPVLTFTNLELRVGNHQAHRLNRR
jgi:hypothetical protein